MKTYAKLLIASSLMAATTLSAQPASIGNTCTPPPANMIGWWTGDGHAKDIVGHHDGILKGGANANAQGLVDKSFDLTGAGDSVVIKDHAPFDFSFTRSFTIDTWVNAGKEQANGAVGIINKLQGSDSGRYALQIYTKNGVSKADFFTSEGHGAAANDNLRGSSKINDGKWHHLTVTYDASTQKKRLYVDGSQEAAARLDLTKDNFFSSGALVFGGSKAKNFNGYIDEVEIFDRALSKGEINRIVLAGKYGKCKK